MGVLYAPSLQTTRPHQGSARLGTSRQDLVPRRFAEGKKRFRSNDLVWRSCNDVRVLTMRSDHDDAVIVGARSLRGDRGHPPNDSRVSPPRAPGQTLLSATIPRPGALYPSEPTSPESSQIAASLPPEHVRARLRGRQATFQLRQRHRWRSPRSTNGQDLWRTSERIRYEYHDFGTGDLPSRPRRPSSRQSPGLNPEADEVIQ